MTITDACATCSLINIPANKMTFVACGRVSSLYFDILTGIENVNEIYFIVNTP